MSKSTVISLRRKSSPSNNLNSNSSVYLKNFARRTSSNPMIGVSSPSECFNNYNEVQNAQTAVPGNQHHQTDSEIGVKTGKIILDSLCTTPTNGAGSQKTAKVKNLPNLRARTVPVPVLVNENNCNNCRSSVSSAGKNGGEFKKKFALVESACDDQEPDTNESLEDICMEEKSGLCHVVSPKPGVPFSAVTPSMWPPDEVTTSGDDNDSGFDELGFRIEEEDGPEQSSNKLLGIPFAEDQTVRKRKFCMEVWTAGFIPLIWKNRKVFCMDVRDELIIVGTAGKQITVWDLRSMKVPVIDRPSKLFAYQTRCIKLFPNKKSYALGTLEGRVSIDSIQPDETGLPVYAFKPHVEKPSGVGHPINSIALQWLAYLEFSHSREEVQELSWDSLPPKLPVTQKLYDMMRCKKNGGIPHSLRPQLWLRLSGAFVKKIDPANLPYWKVVKESTLNEYFSFAKHIEKDLIRILPANGCFTKLDSPGIPRLRRVLRAIAWLYPDIGYCQGMGTIVAHLLLFFEEEDAFWLMCSIVEDILPSAYFTADFSGIKMDSMVLASFVKKYFPKIDDLLKEHDIELGLIVFTWFLTLFASVVHVKILLRVWDLFFAEGDIVVFKVMLALIKYKDEELLQLKNSAEIFNFLSDLPTALDDFDILELDKFESLNKNSLETERKKAASETSKLGSPDSSTTTSSIFSSSTKHRKVKKRDTRKQEKTGKGNVLKSFFGEGRGPEDMKNKNVRQTELMVDLHDAILQIGRHFISNDPKFMKVSLDPDFSVESHTKDHERFSQGFIMGVKRAKALVDFERRDDDELGFRKNDIITVVNCKDEHCWVGELNGLRGWFPAKFVSILDERSKQYTPAGDDSVTEGIADLVRGTLCPALKRVLEHGMKKPASLIGPHHPWLFIEEVATKEIERDFKSVYSRLVLCKTYRLDEDGKVLSPEELLYRCVELVNRSHEKVQMDVKLRSLICLGLNEQVLHLWVEILCSCADVVNKWYHPWSFLNSPGWIGLKCELRMLSQFSFSLSLEWELRALKEDKLEVKSGVRDMLVKHHLFSWNL